MNKVKLGLQDKSRQERIAQARAIQSSLTGNANFPAPSPTLPAYDALIAAAEAKLAAYNSVKLELTMALTELDAAMKSLDSGTTLLGSYAESASAGDAAKLLSGGFEVRSRSAALPPPAQVPGLVLSAGEHEGRLEASWASVHGVGCYEVHTSSDPMSATSWAIKSVSIKTKVTLEELTSGSRIWVRVRAIGSGNTPGPWSDPAVKTVP